MRSVQDVGTEILTGNPQSFYIFAGSEYGIKRQYIESLTSHYGECKEYGDVNSVIKFMSMKHMFPVAPAVYVVRYDEDFVSSLDDAMVAKIRKCNIIGTLVCIYEQPKHINKLDKYLPEYTVSLDAVNPQFIAKYLRKEFTSVDDRAIQLAVSLATDYNQARLICGALSTIDTSELMKYTDADIAHTFGKEPVSTDTLVKIGVASRNFKYLSEVLDAYQDNLDSFLYSMLSALVELDKIAGNKYAQSPLREYVNRWTSRDVYNMFCHIYNEIKKIRTVSQDPKHSIIYLMGLTQFQRIPEWEGN